MNKLPASKFDEIYEACKDSGFHKHTGNPFSYYLDQHESKITTRYWKVSFALMQNALLEAYRTGEIRDAGAYPEKSFYVRLVKAPRGTWYVGQVGTTWEVVDIGKEYTYRLVDDTEKGIYKTDCEIVETPQQPWYKLDHKVFDPLVDDPYNRVRPKIIDANSRLYEIISDWDTTYFQDEQIIDSLYKAGILRDAGAMEEQSYDHAFSVKDGRMEVDWGALEVTKENALEISIASWKWLYEWLNNNEGIPGRGGLECGLCRVFHNCGGCPVNKKTCGCSCAGTAFWDYVYATTKHEALDACRDEIAFLEGLR